MTEEIKTEKRTRTATSKLKPGEEREIVKGNILIKEKQSAGNACVVRTFYKK